MTRQYVQVKLSPRSEKLYTYLNDQPANITEGDTVEIEMPSGERRLVDVVTVSDDLPPTVPGWVTLKPCYKGG